MIAAAYTFATFLGDVTGMCINPFLSLATTTIAIAVQNQYAIDTTPKGSDPPEYGEYARYLWVYAIFPVIGAAIASYVHKSWHSENCDGIEKKR
jgi:glycerol uptake facilitator-like aquaporin